MSRQMSKQAYLRKALIADNAALSQWEDITALARNEWICWIEDAIKPEQGSEE